MKTKPSSYSRFYALLAKMGGDRNVIKETLISRFTDGKTTSLREMNATQYNAMCEAMEAELAHPGLSAEEHRRELKRLRSAVLHRMQKLGIDTASWSAVDAFCLQPRIAGKKFAQLDHAELEVMIAKLGAMRRKAYTVKTRMANELMMFMMRQSQVPS